MSLDLGEEFPPDDTHAPGIIDHKQAYISPILVQHINTYKPLQGCHKTQSNR